MLFCWRKRSFGEVCRKQFSIPVFALSFLSLVFSVFSQKLPVKTYTVADGLAHGVIVNMHQDRKGYLWFATYEGLSRFDGYGFYNYGIKDGLNDFLINDVTSDNLGVLWVGTNGGGLARLADSAQEKIPARNRKRFESFLIEAGDNNPANAVNRILFDDRNRLWCVTDKGIYRADDPQAENPSFVLVMTVPPPDFNNAAFRDTRGRLWFGINERVVKIENENLTVYVPIHDSEPGKSKIPESNYILSITEDSRQRILAADTESIYVFDENASAGENGFWRRWSLNLSPEQDIRSIIDAGEGGLLIGTTEGLIQLQDERRKLYTTENGLNANRIRSLLRDREGNLWIGMEGKGICKMLGDNIVNFSFENVLPSSEVYRLSEDAEGRIYALVGCAPRVPVVIADEKMSLLSQIPLAQSLCFKLQVERDDRGNTWYHTKNHLMQDAHGNWWINTRRGLEFSFGPQLDFQKGFLLGTKEGWQEDFYTELYHEAGGKIWIVNGRSGNLYLGETFKSKLPRFSRVASGLEKAEFLIADSSGTLWIGAFNKIWRLIEGRIVELVKSDGLPALQPRTMFRDSRGRVWIGLRYNGVSMTENPSADDPQFVNYTTAQGLSSDTVWSITEDKAGNIYFGTARGVDRLDLKSGKIRHYTAREGAAGSVINYLMTDSRGQVWIGTDEGVSRFKDRQINLGSSDAPPIFFSGVTIAGEDMSLPETGVSVIAPTELSASQNNIVIKFVGLSHRGLLNYRYKLEGIDADWVNSGERREVVYANLAPGTYRFVASAVDENGVSSSQPAVFEFRIFPPFYLRWWFIAAAVCLLGLAIYGIYRNRLRRLLEMERMRTRIATDLHDDIGANLSRISFLSEAAKRQSGNGQTLSSISEIARESVSSMSDIVWAIAPEHDRLLDLTRRMRQHAEEIFAFREVELRFNAPPSDADMQLSVNLRRDVLLIFKEAVNNAARHSECTSVEIDFGCENYVLCLQISDNGKGFEIDSDADGHGLRNMKRRGAALGGKLNIDSQPGNGTSVRFELPLRKANPI